jgi:hypothetical protein
LSEFVEFIEEVGCLLLEDVDLALSELEDEAAFGEEDGVFGGVLIPEGGGTADIAFLEVGDEDLHPAFLCGEDEGFAVGGDKDAFGDLALLDDCAIGFDGVEEEGLEEEVAFGIGEGHELGVEAKEEHVEVFAGEASELMDDDGVSLGEGREEG